MSEEKFTVTVAPRVDNPNRALLKSNCEKGCAWSISTNQPLVEGVHWRWDGNVNNPTVTPSIDCRGGCGRHFNVINGNVK